MGGRAQYPGQSRLRRAASQHSPPTAPWENDVTTGAGDAAVIKTAGRVFEILEYMREVRRQVSVRELAEHFGYPLSSTQVLLKSMAALGYLRHDARAHAFFPSARLAHLGDWVIDFLFQGGRLLALLEEVALATGQTAILGVENDLYAHYVQVILSRQAIQFNVPPGTRRLLCQSGMGWALLSSHDDAQIISLVQRTNARLGRSVAPLESSSVLEQVAIARRQGYAFSRGTVTEGVGIIAMPLPVGPGGERIGIGVGGPLERLERAHESIVKAIGERITQYLVPVPAAALPAA